MIVVVDRVGYIFPIIPSGWALRYNDPIPTDEQNVDGVTIISFAHEIISQNPSEPWPAMSAGWNTIESDAVSNIIARIAWLARFPKVN